MLCVIPFFAFCFVFVVVDGWLVGCFLFFKEKSKCKRDTLEIQDILFILHLCMCVIWNVLLYMCCFYWLMNKAVWANGLAR